MRKNSAVIKNGHKKAVNMLDLHIETICKRMAIEAIWGAVSAWDSDPESRDLTGNTRTSFGAGVYHDGRVVAIYNVFNIDKSIEMPTRGMTFVGDSGFRVYGSNYYIGAESDPFVQQYRKDSGFSFQLHNKVGAYGHELTSNFLNSIDKKPKDWTVIVASVSPYGEYLRNVRKLDILDSQIAGMEVAKNFKIAIAASGKLDQFKL